MKKLFFIIVIMFAIFTLESRNTYSQCVLPAGVSNIPAWTQGTPVKIYLNSANTCWVIYRYCYRTNSLGEFEVVLTGSSLGSTQSSPFNFSSFFCALSFMFQQQMLQDRAVSSIVNSQKVFGNIPVTLCPALTSPYFRVYAASCQTEWFWDSSQPNEHGGIGVLTRVPCSLEGFCKYKYKYCYEVVDGVTILRQSRTLETGSGTQCPGNYTYPETQVVYNCYPIDCYPNILFKPVANDNDIWNNITDEVFYQ